MANDYVSEIMPVCADNKDVLWATGRRGLATDEW